jgi:hypothetical protein
MQQFFAVIGEERAADAHIASREIIANAMAGRTQFFVCLRWFRQPLPPAIVKYGTTLRANSWLSQFVLGLVGIVSILLQQAVTTHGFESCKSGFHVSLRVQFTKSFQFSYGATG